MNLIQDLIESAYNDEPMVAEVKGIKFGLRFCKKVIKDPIDSKNQAHGLKFFSFSKIFFKEYQVIEDKTGKSFYLKDFKDFKDLEQFFISNDYFFLGVDIYLSDKVLLRETNLYPNLGYVYADKKILSKLFNIQDLEESEVKPVISQIFIPDLESYLNGEVFELFIEYKEKKQLTTQTCYGKKGVENLIDLTLKEAS